MPRKHPAPKNLGTGDFVVIRDAGAHGRAMGFNYNGKLRCGRRCLFFLEKPIYFILWKY